MKKALLMTWFNTPNYGTLLQCDATINLFKERYGIDIEVANYTPVGKRDVRSIIKKIFSIHTWNRRLQMVVKQLQRRSEKEGFIKKQKMVDDFINRYQYAFNGKKIQSDKDFSKLNSGYNVFISGSDQIWNPDFLNERFLLNFVEDDKQCISFASSISKKEIDEKYISIYKELLHKYKYITIREKGNIEQLERIIGKPVFAILDPTILYGPENWKMRLISNDERDYILVYILGTSKKIRNIVIDISRSLRKKIFFFPHMDGLFTKEDSILSHNGSALWGESPYKWLGWISGADYIITDSFHMMIFSIMFHKEFYVVPKENNNTAQNNRIKNLLNIVGLPNRFVDSDELMMRIKCNSQINWDMVDNILNRERIKSLDILDEIVGRLRWEIE